MRLVEEVGTSTVRYNFIKLGMTSQVTFDRVRMITNNKVSFSFHERMSSNVYIFVSLIYTYLFNIPYNTSYKV